MALCGSLNAKHRYSYGLKLCCASGSQSGHHKEQEASLKKKLAIEYSDVPSFSELFFCPAGCTVQPQCLLCLLVLVVRRLWISLVLRVVPILHRNEQSAINSKIGSPEPPDAKSCQQLQTPSILGKSTKLPSWSRTRRGFVKDWGSMQVDYAVSQIPRGLSACIPGKQPLIVALPCKTFEEIRCSPLKDEQCKCLLLMTLLEHEGNKASHMKICSGTKRISGVIEGFHLVKIRKKVLPLLCILSRIS